MAISLFSSVSGIEKSNNDFIDLSFNIQYEDNMCDTEIYLVQFDGSMNFYTDSQYQILQTNDGLYEIGIDIIYIELIINFENDALNIINTELINVWLCTIDEDEEIIQVSQTGNSGGCYLTTNIDNNQPYHIIENSEIRDDYLSELETKEYDTTISNTLRFSFKVPKDLFRDKLYIHTQILINLINNNNGRRMQRRLILSNKEQELNNNQDQLRHFIKSADIGNNNIKDDKKSKPDYDKFYINNYVVMIGLGIFLLLIGVLILIASFKYSFKKKNKYNKINTNIFSSTEEDERQVIDINQE